MTTGNLRLCCLSFTNLAWIRYLRTLDQYISNLPFIAKTVEKAAISQLLNHCTANAPLPANQSSYRQFHYTEKALLKVQNDILTCMDNQEVMLFVMLDLSAAFDTIDHMQSPSRYILEKDFGVIDSAQNWFKSFRFERKQQVIIDQFKSAAFDLTSGVPQGSCLSPNLFLLYALYLSVRPHPILIQQLRIPP